MKKIQLFYLLLIIIIFHVSCKKQWDPYKSRNASIFTLNNIDVKDIKEYAILNEEVNLDSIEFPQRIAVKNEHLVISDSKGDKLLHLFDIQRNKHLLSFCNKGPGPNENLYVWDLNFSEKNEIYFTDAVKMEFVKYSINDLLNTETEPSANDIKKIKFDASPISLVTSNGEHYFVEAELGNSRIYKTNTLFTEYSNFGSGSLLDQTNYELPEILISGVSECRLDVLENTFFISYLYAPLIEVFNGKGEMIKAHLGPEQFIPVFSGKNKKDKIRFAPISGKTKNGYFDMCVSEKYAYALYDGKIEKSNFDGIGNNTLIVLDLNGDIVRAINLPISIFDFAVQDDKRVFGITYEIDGPAIVYFDI